MFLNIEWKDISNATKRQWSEFNMAKNDKRVPCPVCGTKDALDGVGTFDTCMTCGWIDEPSMRDDPDYKSKYWPVPLNEAKKKWEAGESISSLFPNPQGKK